MPFDAAEFRWGGEPNTPRPARRAHWVDLAKTVALTFVAVPSAIGLGGLASAAVDGFPPAAPIGAEPHHGSLAAHVTWAATWLLAYAGFIWWRVRVEMRKIDDEVRGTGNP